MDAIYLAVIVGFFAISWGLTTLADRLAGAAISPEKEQRR